MRLRRWELDGVAPRAGSPFVQHGQRVVARRPSVTASKSGGLSFAEGGTLLTTVLRRSLVERASARCFSKGMIIKGMIIPIGLFHDMLLQGDILEYSGAAECRCFV